MCPLMADKCKQRNTDRPLVDKVPVCTDTPRNHLLSSIATPSETSTVIMISGFREDTIPILHKLEASSLKKKKHQKKYCVDHCFSPVCAQRTCQKLMELVTNHITFCVCCLLNLPRCHNQHTCLLNRETLGPQQTDATTEGNFLRGLRGGNFQLRNAWTLSSPI